MIVLETYHAYAPRARTGEAAAPTVGGGHAQLMTGSCRIENGKCKAMTGTSITPREVSPRRTAVRAQRVHPVVAHRLDAHTRRLAATAGVLVVPDVQQGRQVTRTEMQQAIAALQMLPAADLALVARHNITIHLVPASGLEDGLLGATTIIQNDPTSPWIPTKIRIAVRAGLTGTESIGEIVQHEFGHAVSVLRQQDRSEAAAIKYAREH